MLRPGEPVTWVHWIGATAQDRVCDVGATWFTVEGLTSSLATQDEGTTWIRGHHLEGSPEAMALLAAYALQGRAA